jgi:uncharacterized C2H2 Zn-finger protein
VETAADTEVFYKLCPRCARAVPLQSTERHCINDGEKLLERCPKCEARIASPYARHCGACGFRFAETSHESSRSRAARDGENLSAD